MIKIINCTKKLSHFKKGARKKVKQQNELERNKTEYWAWICSHLENLFVNKKWTQVSLDNESAIYKEKKKHLF